MISSKKLLLFCIVVLSAAADERDECMKEHNITMKEMSDSIMGDISEKVLCFMKCAFERKGAIDINRRINMEKMDEIMDQWAHLSDKGKSFAVPCLQEYTIVRTCSDVKPLHLCLEDAREFQLNTKCHVNNPSHWRKMKGYGR
ncbi:hypothetical protein WA026_011040 [Henosepilachna vigintioctopunctata]|uniref:Uncharacterized protein n=1 Tax=Henosepilachna vigintioctopunctata TaxID=420089 RepID=A0AAW1U4M6_9CUCU